MKRAAAKLAVVIGTGLGAGYFPIAPGTVGSAVAVAIYAVLARLRLVSTSSVTAWLILAGAVFGLGWASAWHLERRFGPDNKRIVVDEVWGMLISLAFLPVAPLYALGAFLLFRFFDIVKPFPARRAERVGGGLGVMLDDGVAGVYANLVLVAVRHLVG